MSKNKISDFFHFLFSRITYLIIVAILFIIILSRLNNLFNLGLLESEKLNKIGLQTEEEVKVDNKPVIVYEGGKPEPENPENMRFFTIKPEDVTPEKLSLILKEEGFIQDPDSLVILIDNLSLRNNIVPGYYEVPFDISNLGLLSKVTGTPEEILELRKEMIDNNKGNEVATETVTFTILEGSSAENAAEILKQAGLIQDSASFIGILNQNGLRDMIRPGEYTVDKNIKNLDLIEKITINPNEVQSETSN